MDKERKIPGKLPSGLLHKAKGFRVAAATIIVIISTFLTVIPVSAVDPAVPSPFSIGTPQVFKNIFETNDYMLVFPYDISYATAQPVTPASSLFIYRLMSGDGLTAIGSAVPYPYNNSGYGQGMVSIYFPASTAPTWGSPYIIRIDGNPLYWITPPSVTHTLSPTEYCAGTTQSENRLALSTFILNEAALLEVNWGVKLYDTNGTGGISLTSTGQTYFTTTIPGLGTACASIMAVSQSQPEYTDPAKPGTSAAYNWLHQWDGTVLQNWGNNIGGQLGGLNWQSVTSGFLLILLILLAGFSQVKFGNTDAAYLAGGADLIIATFAGFIWYAIMGVIFLGMLWYVSQTQFWRNL